jgi:glycerol-1-phosphate dehydrogenase [NAD(P)+]
MRISDFCPQPLPSHVELPEEVVLESGAARLLPEVSDRFLGDSVLLVADPDTRHAAQEAVENLLHQSPHVREHVLGKHPHADEPTVETAFSLSEGSGGMVAVGSGPVNDIVKLAAKRRGIPYVILGTAASMDGYSCGNAAILVDGVKTAAPASPPKAILLDLDILSQAPPEMARSGLGDIIGKPISNADWWLENFMENTGYDDLPGRISSEAAKKAAESAAGLASGDPAAYEALARSLVLSGVSMAVAGCSKPASGGEHLIGHLWDMEAIVAGRELRLHGSQVGVATLLVAAIYQLLLDLRQPVFKDPPKWEREEKRIRTELGVLSEKVLPDARKKHLGAIGRVCNLEVFWREMMEDLREFHLPTVEEIRSSLAAAGAPHTLSDLGYARGDARRGLRNARHIRNRYTELDLAFELGLFPDAIDDAIEAAGV